MNYTQFQTYSSYLISQAMNSKKMVAIMLLGSLCYFAYELIAVGKIKEG
jgi:hypothetical protein